jgi:hypothetical protein
VFRLASLLWRLRRATAIVFPTAQNPKDLHGNHLYVGLIAMKLSTDFNISP